MSGVELGRVAALWRYQVKSMAAEPLDSVEVGWHGLAGDRRWAFIRNGKTGSGFPWLTIRERPDMRHYRPAFARPDRPDGSAVMVRTPSGATLDVLDPALVAELGDGVRLIKQNVGIFDAMPISVITTQTIASLAELVGHELEVQRFRPNMLIESSGHADFPEDAWVGSVLEIGELRMRVDKRDERCVMVNIDPVTNRRSSAVLRTIARQRQARLGVYGTIVAPGRVSRGDRVVCSSA